MNKLNRNSLSFRVLFLDLAGVLGCLPRLRAVVSGLPFNLAGVLDCLPRLCTVVRGPPFWPFSQTVYR